MLPLPWWKLSNVTNLPQGNWLITMVNSVISGLSVGLCCWQIGHSAVAVARSLGEWKSMLLSLCITSISATKATLFMNTLDNDRSGCRKRLTMHRTGHSIHLIIKILLCWSHTLVSTHMEYKYLQDFCQRGLAYTSSPNFLVINFPIMFLPSPWPSRQTIGHSLWISI